MKAQVDIKIDTIHMDELPFFFKSSFSAAQVSHRLLLLLYEGPFPW